MALRSRPLDAQVPSKGWSIRHRLMLLALALALALPFILLTAGIVRQLADNQRETRREAILFSTRTLMNAVDTIVNKQVTMAQMLATSPTLQTDDLSALRKEAERASPGLSDGWIVLSDQDGQKLVNLSRPEGEALPRRPPGALELQRRALETGQFQISGSFTKAPVQTPVVTVEVPVPRNGKPALALTMVMRPNVFLTLFEERNLSEGWLAGLRVCPETSSRITKYPEHEAD